jgi:hypothetical protein
LTKLFGRVHQIPDYIAIGFLIAFAMAVAAKLSLRVLMIVGS